MRSLQGGRGIGPTVYGKLPGSFSWERERTYRRMGIGITLFSGSYNYPSYGTTSYLYRDMHTAETCSAGVSGSSVWADLKLVRAAILAPAGEADNSIYPASLERETNANALDKSRDGADWQEGVRLAAHNVFQVWTDGISRHVIRPEQWISTRFRADHTNQDPPINTSGSFNNGPIYFTAETAAENQSGTALEVLNDGWSTDDSGAAKVFPGRMIYDSSTSAIPAWRPAIVIDQYELEQIYGVLAILENHATAINCIINNVASAGGCAPVASTYPVTVSRKPGAGDVPTERYHP